jgi:rhodanese-related sulfurtransferase
MSILKRKSKKDFEELEPKEAFIKIEKHRDDQDFVVLDVRTHGEYQTEHLENALLLDVNSNDFEGELDKMDKDKTYFVYCKAGRRSLNAIKLMKKDGYENLININGGIDKWKSKRLPVTKD